MDTSTTSTTNSFLDGLMAKARDTLWDESEIPEIAPTSINAVRNDSFDQMTWQSTIAMAPAIPRVRDDLAVNHPTAPEALEDLFNLLLQGDPRMERADQMAGEYATNHRILDDLSESDELIRLRESTRYDEYASTFALLGMESNLRAAFDQIKETRDQAEKAQQELQDALQAAQNAQGTNGEGAAEEALGDALSAAQAAGAAQQKADDQAGTDLTNAARSSSKELEQEKADMAGYGTDAGELQRLPYGERRKLVERFNRSRMAKLAAYFGSFRQFADAERRRKVKHAPAEVHSYYLSNDLTKLAPEELNNLAVPELEELFWLRWAQHALLTKEVHGPDRAGKGPIIVVCDESASMTEELDRDGNTREAWSKALALALCDQAKANKRDFTYIGFGSEHDPLFEMSFPKGVSTLEQTITFVEHFLCGGTGFEKPLRHALGLIEESRVRNQSRPDIVFITDGDARVLPEFITEWRASLDGVDAKCYGIQVGGESLATKALLTSLCDRTMSITKLNASPEGVEELFRAI